MGFLIPPIFFALTLLMGVRSVDADFISEEQIQLSRQLLLKCKHFRKNHPAAYVDLAATKTFTVILDKTERGPFCAYTDVDDQVITIFDRVFREGRCTPLTQLLAHEMLHAVGIFHTLDYENPDYWTKDQVKVIENTCVKEMEYREFKKSKSH